MLNINKNNDNISTINYNFIDKRNTYFCYFIIIN